MRKEDPQSASEDPTSETFWRDSGLITRASDDDPSGIATYSQSGARFGYSLLWIKAASYPLIGPTTGHGIAANPRHYPNGFLQIVVVPSVAAVRWAESNSVRSAESNSAELFSLSEL